MHIYSRETERFEWKEGPVFTNVLLADEINRATPRTQAGLLECMEERQVTVDGETRKMEEPFFVIATQNPVETAGTFPLPEAQTDRFIMKLSMGLPDREEEIRILETYKDRDPLPWLRPVMSREELLSIKEEAEKIYVHPLINGYLADIALATRKQEKVVMGVSPRGTLALMRCAKARACMEGRSYVIPDDVKKLASAVLAHRLMFSFGRSRQEEAVKLMDLRISCAGRKKVWWERYADYLDCVRRRISVLFSEVDLWALLGKGSFRGAGLFERKCGSG